jgi:quercetin dioxygenase-like cupin family protein
VATTFSLAGWDIKRVGEAEWLPWGELGDARAKLLASADGFSVALVEAPAGYRGTSHEHAHTEMLHVLDGRVRTQGVVMEKGDTYAAAAGSSHDDFVAETAATYLSIFRL